MSLVVAIPVYNEEKYLIKTLNSLKTQNIDCTFFVADNHSDDKSWEIISDVASIDDRFVIFRHNENFGGFFNGEFLYEKIMELSPDFFMFMGGHDVLSDGYLKNVLALLEQDSTASMAMGLPCVIDEEDKFTGVNESAIYDFTHENPLKRYIDSIMQLSNCTCFQSIYRTEHFKSFKLKQTLSADHVFISHALWRGKLIFSKEDKYFRRCFPKTNSMRESYTQRLTGNKSRNLNRRGFYEFYLDNFAQNFNGDERFKMYLDMKIIALLEKRWGSHFL